MTKTKLELAKEQFDSIFAKAQANLEAEIDTQVDLVAEWNIGDTVEGKEDGEVTEGEFIYTIKDGVVTDKQPIKAEVEEAKVDENLEDKLEEDKEEVIEEAKEEEVIPEGISIDSEALIKVIGEATEGVIPFTVVDGVLTWGDIITEPQVAMAAHNTEVSELKEALIKKEKMITTLSASYKDTEFEILPREIKIDKVSQVDKVRQSINK